MYNKKGEVKMDKTILVVEVIKYKNIPTAYHIKKTADVEGTIKQKTLSIEEGSILKIKTEIKK